MAGCRTYENPFQTMAGPVPVAAEAPPPATLPPQPWRGVDATTGQIADVEGLEELGEDFPNSSSVRLRLLNAHIAAEQWPAALGMGERLVAEGYAFSPAAREYLTGIVQTGVIPGWLGLAERNGEPVTASDVAAEISDGALLPEAVLYDPANDRLLVTTIVSRGLFVRDGQEDWRQVPIAGAGSLGGIALDERRGLVWLGSGVVDPTPEPETAFRGMIAVDRSTLEVRRRVAVPADATISDIAVGPDGTVYGSDPIGGGVWTATLTDTAMTPLIAPGTFRSPQGLAVRPDGRSLFVSDYRYGLAVVTLPSRQVYRVQSEVPALLDGVDGLWLHGNELVVVQNGLSPHRIVAFELGGGIGTIIGQRVLEAANPGWTEPLGGAITAGALYYIGNGSWDLFGEGGALNEGAELRQTQVRRLDLAQYPASSPQ